jgi:hypothetical protein
MSDLRYVAKGDKTVYLAGGELPPIKWWNRSNGTNRCRCRLSFLAAKEVGAVLKPALEPFVARGHAVCSAKKLGAVVKPVLELVISLNLPVDFPEIR